MRTKAPVYVNAEYKALVNGYLVPDEGTSFPSVAEAERVARTHAFPGDIIEVYDVTHQAVIVLTKVRRSHDN